MFYQESAAKWLPFVLPSSHEVAFKFNKSQWPRFQKYIRKNVFFFQYKKVNNSLTLCRYQAVNKQPNTFLKFKHYCDEIKKALLLQPHHTRWRLLFFFFFSDLWVSSTNHSKNNTFWLLHFLPIFIFTIIAWHLSYLTSLLFLSAAAWVTSTSYRFRGAVEKWGKDK